MSGRLTPVWAMCGTRQTTGEAIADAAEFGVIGDDTIDLTIGVAAGFWTDYRPARLVTNDANPDVPADHHVDVEIARLPHLDGTFDTVVFDPPYRMSGTSSKDGGNGVMNDRYGVDRYRPKREIWSIYRNGVAEAVRLSNRWVIVKCMDQTSSGAFQGQSQHVWRCADELGCSMEFVLYVVAAPRPAGRSRRAPPAGQRQPADGLRGAAMTHWRDRRSIGFIRSSSGAPWVDSPDLVNKNGKAKRILRRRASSYAELIIDDFGLRRHAQRQLLVAARFLSADDRAVLGELDLDDRETAAHLDEVIEELHAANRSRFKAERGTWLHELTEEVDRDL